VFNKRSISWIISFLIAAGFVVSLLNEVLNQWVPYRVEKFFILVALSLLATPIFYLVWYRRAWLSLAVISEATKIGWVVFSVLIAWVIYAVLPAPTPHYSHLLNVNVLGDENPASQSNRVVLVRVLSNEGDLKPPALVLSAGWNQTENGYTAASFPAQASWAGMSSGDLTLSFVNGPDAGLVQVSWDEKTQVIDLYSPAEKTSDVILPGTPEAEGSLSRQLVLVGLEAAEIFLIWLPVFLVGTWVGMRQIHLTVN